MRILRSGTLEKGGVDLISRNAAGMTHQHRDTRSAFRMNSPASSPNITFAVEPLPALGALETVWRQFDRDGGHSFFLTWAWIGTWLKCIPATTRVMLLKAVEAGETIGVALITLKEGTVRGIFPIRQAWLNCAGDPALDCLTIEHNGFASASARDAALLPALEDWFAEGGLVVDECVLPGIGPNICSSTDNRLLLIERREPGYRAPLRQIASGGGLVSVLSRNGRYQLRRSIRAWERHGPLTIDRAEDGVTGIEFFTKMKELHIRSWTHRGERHAFSSPFFETFHRTLIPVGIAEGSVDLLRVCAGTRAIGYLYNFRRNGTVFSYQSGFDDSESRLRPGYVSHALAIAHYTAEGMSHYDFLAQANRLKQSFGTEHYELCWRRLRMPILGFRVEAAARKVVTRLKGKAN